MSDRPFRILRREVRPIVPGQRRTIRGNQGDDAGQAPLPPSEESKCQDSYQEYDGVFPMGSNSEEEWVVELSGGDIQPLRLSEETELAWAMGRCVETTCLVCTIRLICVDDCDCIICSECFSLSPVDRETPRSSSHRGGVGVGIPFG